MIHKQHEKQRNTPYDTRIDSFFFISNVYLSKAQRGATLVYMEYTRENA